MKRRGRPAVRKGAMDDDGGVMGRKVAESFFVPVRAASGQWHHSLTVTVRRQGHHTVATSSCRGSHRPNHPRSMHPPRLRCTPSDLPFTGSSSSSSSSRRMADSTRHAMLFRTWCWWYAYGSVRPGRRHAHAPPAHTRGLRARVGARSAAPLPSSSSSAKKPACLPVVGSIG